MISSATIILLRATRRLRGLLRLNRSEGVLEIMPSSHTPSIPSCPMASLPPELLGMIFRFYSDGETREVLLVLLVCKYWYHVSSNTPNLWTRVTIKLDAEQYFHTLVDRHIRYIQISAGNSGSLPLELRVDYSAEIEDAFALREAVRRVFLELKGTNSTLLACWGSLHLALPSHNGRPLIGANEAGMVNLSTPQLTKLSIEMLRKPVDYDPAESALYFSNLTALKSLTIDDEYILRHIPTTLEQLEYLDIRLSQQPFNTGELVRFPRLVTLILRHEEKGKAGKTAFSFNALDLLSRSNAVAGLDDHVGTKPSENDIPPVQNLCIQSVWIMQEELPKLMPLTLAWDPLDPSLLGQYKFTEVSKNSLRTLLSKYTLMEHLVLPGCLSRPFFVLIQQEPALASSLQSVLFDMGAASQRFYNMRNGKLRRVCRRVPPAGL